MITTIMNDNDCLAVAGPIGDGVVSLIQSKMSLVDDTRPARYDIGHVRSAVAARRRQECQSLAICSHICIADAESCPVGQLLGFFDGLAGVNIEPHRPEVAGVLKRRESGSGVTALIDH